MNNDMKNMNMCQFLLSTTIVVHDMYLLTVISLVHVFVSQHCYSTFTNISIINTLASNIKFNKYSLLRNLWYTCSTVLVLAINVKLVI